MKSQEAPKILQSAFFELDKAREESSRPEEDVVTFSVCHRIRKSTMDFLRYYLMAHHVDTTKIDKPADLLKMCQELNDSFKDLDFSMLTCFHEPMEKNVTHCLSLRKVNDCIGTVEKTKNLVLQLTGAGKE